MEIGAVNKPPDPESFPMASTDTGIGPARHMLYKEETPGGCRLVSCIQPLDNYDAAEKPKLPQASHGLGKWPRQVWIFNRQPCIEISQVELAELSLFFGMKLTIKMAGTSSRIYGVGAFGTFLNGYVEDGVWRINIAYCHRHRRDVSVKGSGYSTLHAKYIACGCLPFGQERGWIKYVHVNTDVLRAVYSGYSIQDVEEERVASEELQEKRYLEELSTIGGFKCFNTNGPFRFSNQYGVFLDEEGKIVCHTREVEQQDQEEETIKQPNQQGGENKHPNKVRGGNRKQNFGSWSRAVAFVAFGGLVPQATARLAEAIRFTALGNMKLQQDLAEEKLERIINAIHKQHTKDHLFGWFVDYRTYQASKREKFAPSHWDVRRATATFARYMTLIEYLTAHFDDGHLSDGEKTMLPTLGRRGIAFEKLCTSLKEAHEDAVNKKVMGGHDNGRRGIDCCLDHMINRMNGPDRRENFTPSLTDVCDVSRCIIAVWAEHVPRIIVRVQKNASILEMGIENDEQEKIKFDLKHSSIQGQQNKEHVELSQFAIAGKTPAYHAPALEDLPFMAALG